MSIERMNDVWRLAPQKGSELLLLLAIADSANDEGIAWPSQATLARKVRMSERQVRRMVVSLAEAGALSTIVRRQGRKTHTIYRLSTGQDVRTGDGSTGHPGSVTPDIAMSSKPSRTRKPKTLSEVATSGERQRDPLFDALAVACGWKLDSITKEAARLCGIATAEIRKAGGQPEHIRAAVANYRRLYPQAAVTPKALGNHWPEIAPGERERAAAQVCPECELGGGMHADGCSNATEGGSDGREAAA